MRRITSTATTAAAAAALLLSLTAGPALAQDQGGGPSEEEVIEKVKEIERLMKKAEEALARSTARRGEANSEAAKERIEKLLDERARESTGKSADELRKLAEEGSKEASETLRKLMDTARSEAQQSSDGVRKLLDETKQQGQGVSEGIEWLLKNARSNRPQNSPKPPKPDGEKPQAGDKPNEPKPQEGDKPEEDPRDKLQTQRPESVVGEESNPDEEDWVARLPPQVRQAYLSRDWDSIPPKWREIVREWTKKLADEKSEEDSR